MRIDYGDFEGFEDVYLEDSYVLNISESSGMVEFEIEVVLREGHSQYSPPKSGEQYCYRRASIVFPSLKKADWQDRSFVPSVDKDGEVDYGNIDSFYLENDVYHLVGDWGKVLISSRPPTLRFTD